MKIAQFISHYPYARQTADYFTGGTGEVARGLSLALAARGHEVHVVTVAADGRAATELDGPVVVHRCPSNARVAQANISASMLWRMLGVRFDLVHVHAGNPPAPLAGQIYARRHGVPLVLTYHGDPQAGYGSVLRRAGVLGWILALKKVLADADAILCPSEPFLASSRYLRSFLPQVQVIPNGIDPTSYVWAESREQARRALGLPENKHIALFLGSLSPYKSPDLVLKAAAAYPEWGPDVEWVLAGSGSMQSQLQALAHELGVASRTHFLGFVTGEQKLRALRAADVFVLPSSMTTEVFPIVLLEAGAFGLPAVVSDLPTFGAIVEHGRNGLVVSSGSEAGLADAVAQILADGGARTAMGRAAQLGVAQYTWNNLAEAHERVYQRLLSRKEAPCLSA